MDYLSSEFIKEELIMIDKIPTIILRPRLLNKNTKSVILYHGWGSSKEKQRIRGYLLAIVGYQVFIPDAIYHGDRNPLEKYDMDNAKKFFWEIILKNLKESKTILSEIIEKYGGDSERIGVIGNSMGGFTAAGVFTHNNINSAVILNGSCDWGKYNEILRKQGFTEKDINIFLKDNDIIEKFDPANNLDKIINRPILLLHGIEDELIPIECEYSFYNSVRKMYKNSQKIKLIDYTNLNHFVTTNMMDESIKWFKEYI